MYIVHRLELHGAGRVLLGAVQTIILASSVTLERLEDSRQMLVNAHLSIL
jgi:hypothetical protein